MLQLELSKLTKILGTYGSMPDLYLERVNCSSLLMLRLLKSFPDSCVIILDLMLRMYSTSFGRSMRTKMGLAASLESMFMEVGLTVLSYTVTAAVSLTLSPHQCGIAQHYLDTDLGNARDDKPVLHVDLLSAFMLLRCLLQSQTCHISVMLLMSKFCHAEKLLNRL